MKEIALTQGKFAQVDDEDYEVVNKFKWYVCVRKHTSYAIRHCFKTGKNVTISMHRFILGLNQGDKRLGDHKDKNGLNCQKGNLRIATSSQNNCNRTSRKNTTSKYLGVYIHTATVNGKIYKYWAFDLQHDKKQCRKVGFKTEVEAAKAYDEKAKELHGEFASLNFK